MKYVFVFFLSLYSFCLWAEEALPVGCRAISVQEQTSVMLKSEQPRLILIHNLSANELWITHPVIEPSASAEWSSRIQESQWSALFVQDKQFELSCIESKPGHEQQVACANVVALCSFDGITMPKTEHPATSWAAEDMPLSALIAYLGRMGYVLPTSKS